jgi:hypothetical protein
MTPASPTNQALQAQLSALGETVQQGFQRIEQSLLGLDQRLRGLENREAGCQPLINQRLDAAWRTIDELKAEIAAIKKGQADDVNALKKAHADEIVSLKGQVVTLQGTITRLESRIGLVIGIGSLAGSAVIIWLTNNWLGLIK